MIKTIIIYIQFLIFINFAFTAKQVVYGNYKLINKKLPTNHISADTIIWKYYNQDEKLIFFDKLIPSNRTPGVGTNGPGTFSFGFDTDEYFGGFTFTIKTKINNELIEFDATYIDSKNQWVEQNRNNRNLPNLIDDIYIEFDYAEYIKKSMGFLEVITQPSNANLYIDNEYIGKSPISGYNLKSGDYELKIDGSDEDNCKHFQPKSQNVTIEKGNYLFVNDTLDYFPSELKIKSIPPEARLFINKTDYGNVNEGGINVNLEPGENRYIFSIGKHYFSKSLNTCSGNEIWTFNLVKKQISKEKEIVNNSWLSLFGEPNFAKVKINNKTYKAPLSYLPIPTNTKSLTILDNGFLNKSIDLGKYNLKENEHYDLKYTLDSINYLKAMQLSRFYFDGKLFSGFTGFGHIARNQKMRGYSWFGLQLIGISSAIYSFSLINSFNERKQQVCGNYEIAAPQYLEQERANCINAINDERNIITFSIGINLLNAGIHFLSIWDFDR